MTTRRAIVRLGVVAVGDLIERPDGIVEFQTREDYRHSQDRPVLGQQFEDDLGATYRGKRESPLPVFFANLLPEGRLRTLLESRGLVDERDDFGLLILLGSDLPGAVVVESMDGAELGRSLPPTSDAPVADDDPFRFSLAGVQLKFSVVHQGDKLTLPARNTAGNYIVKLHGPQLVGLAENEFSVMQWARAAGLEVPECELRSLDDLKGLPLEEVDPAGMAFVIRRYDRGEAQRIHQEDLAQVSGLRPSLKYDYLKYETVGLLVNGIVGAEGFLEYIRRLAFLVASGNGDAHAKNWSLLYPDGITPQLSPLYDQVFTSAWPRLVTNAGTLRSRARKPELALKFLGKKRFVEVDLSIFERLGNQVALGPEAVNVAREMFDRAADAWRRTHSNLPMLSEHKELLRAYWRTVPCLRDLSLA
jgi:serine/threonine-protein kinase HipA